MNDEKNQQPLKPYINDESASMNIPPKENKPTNNTASPAVPTPYQII